MLRALMEGVAYNMRETLELLRGLDIPVDKIRSSGGGSVSSVWRQIQSDVFGQSVHTINCSEGPAYGVALLAAVGGGAFSSVEEACDSCIHVMHQTDPIDRNVSFYERGFPVFKRLYQSLQPRFEEIADLSTEVAVCAERTR
jgi:xylulokinase